MARATGFYPAGSEFKSQWVNQINPKPKLSRAKSPEISILENVEDTVRWVLERESR